MLDAVIVGAGPNGLTAAARLASEGRRVLVLEAAPTIGGGSRTRLFDRAPGDTGDRGKGPAARYDVCAAVHPFGASSPAFEKLRLHEHGLRWLHPPVAMAHPFLDGTAASLDRSVTVTCAALGRDARRWNAIVGTAATGWDSLRHLVLSPVPTALALHPLAMIRFGIFAGLPATVLCRLFSTRDARALLAGLAAHGGAPLGTPTTGGVALALAAAAHAVGMPFAAEGSQSIVDALASLIRAFGGAIECDRRVRTLDDIPPARAILLDMTPGQAAALIGRAAPRWRHGVAVCKVDLLLGGPLPWTADACRRAGTVHLGVDAGVVEDRERRTARGALPGDPFVILSQPSVADPSRAPDGQHVVWAYRHVPNACDDPHAADGIDAQLDRFAPGWRDLVLQRHVTSAVDYAAYNLSYVGGDIAGGAMTARQTIARPRIARDPYRIAERVWLCSQSTPPGPGVHGMCGWNAAASVLRRPVR